MNVTVEGIQLGYAVASQPLYEGVDVTAAPGSLTAIVGPSGSGKTTVMNCLGLLLRPTTGTVVINGDDAGRWSNAKRRQFWADSAAFVLQEYGLVTEETLAFNVTMSKTLITGQVRGDQDQIASALAAAGLAGRERERAMSLSGGEKQRLSIARALYKDAQVVFVDEPMAALDRANRGAVLGLLRDLAAQGRTVIVATHDEDVVDAADQVVPITRGAVQPA